MADILELKIEEPNILNGVEKIIDTETDTDIVASGEPPTERATPKPKRKAKKPMSEHHKAKCVASLKKAREASAIKRAKTAEAKRIIKKEEADKLDSIINNSREKERSDNAEKDKIILRLQKQLDNITLNDVIKKPPAKQPKKPKMVTIIEDEIIDENPMPIPAPAKVISKTPIQSNEISSKNKIPQPYKCKPKKNKASKFF